jgi:ATP-dependent Lon protease
VDGSELQNAIHQQLQRKDSKFYLAEILFKVKKTVDKDEDSIEKQICLRQFYSNVL